MHRARQLFRFPALAVLTGLGLLLGLTTVPAQAADTLSYTWLTGHGVYRLAGRVPGVPGNAHTGFVYFDDADTVALMYDWTCPAGVLPPDDYFDGLPASACTVLRSREFYYTPAPTTSGALKATFSGPLHLLTYETGQVKDVSAFYVAFTRSGPITRTRTNVTATGYAVVQTAPMTFSGRLDWLRLDDPRVEKRILYYQRESDYRTDAAS